MIRDRIKELRRVRASDLVPNPANWRLHPDSQREALRGVLAEIGYADALVAREREDGKLELIDGHLRAEDAGSALVPVLVLDVTEDEGRTLLATLDPLAAMAETNSKALNELLGEIEAGDEAVQQMLAELAQANPLPQDEVELKPINVKPPPAMTWVLIGIPTVRFGEIAADVERFAALPDTVCETTVSDGTAKK